MQIVKNINKQLLVNLWLPNIMFKVKSKLKHVALEGQRLQKVKGEMKVNCLEIAYLKVKLEPQPADKQDPCSSRFELCGVDKVISSKLSSGCCLQDSDQ